MTKIDGCFVKDIHNNEFNQVMVKNINELAKSINMKTVAEFVEDQDIADTLHTIGVDYAQGYHFHQPQQLAAPTSLTTIKPINNIGDNRITH